VVYNLKTNFITILSNLFFFLSLLSTSFHWTVHLWKIPTQYLWETYKGRKSILTQKTT